MDTRNQTILQPVNVLAFDTSGQEASLALWAAGIMRSVSLPMGAGLHSQAACLLPMMQNLLQVAGLNFSDLDVIATPVGPGSFTGIRIGLATAQGLALSLKLKIFAPSTFRLFAFGAWHEKKDNVSFSSFSCLVTLPTKRDSFYTQVFQDTYYPLGPARIQTEENIQSFLSLNPDISRISDLSTLNAETLVHFYFNQMASGGASKDEQNLRPYYVHTPEFAKQNI